MEEEDGKADRGSVIGEGSAGGKLLFSILADRRILLKSIYLVYVLVGITAKPIRIIIIVQ